MKTLNSILKGVDFKGKSDDRFIENISYDSRRIKTNSLFIAISGFKSDGHNYIENAIESGATAIVAENINVDQTNSIPFLKVNNSRKAMSKIAANFFNNCSKKITITGVTGTNGKTTTTQIINHILENNLKKTCALGTLGFQFQNGVKNIGFTTPESIELQQIFQTINNAGISHLNMEVSSHALSLNRVENVDIDIAVFTNLTEEHLDFHGTMDNYFNAKLKLFQNLDSHKLAVINYDDLYCSKIINETKAKVKTYGFNKKSNLYASNINMSYDGTEFFVNYQDDKNNIKKFIKVKTNLIGEFNIQNILAAIAVCRFGFKIPIKNIVKSIEKIKNIPGRFETYKSKNNATIIVDYAHTPDAFKKILSLVKKIDSSKRIITLFGCGGDRDKNKRPLMANISEKFSDKIILTDDNPRNESSETIFQDIISGFKKSSYEIIKDRKQAIKQAVNTLSENDILLVLGKGIENYQIFNEKKFFHNDINEIKELIK